MLHARPYQKGSFRKLTSAIWVLLVLAIFATAFLTQRSLSRLADSRDVIAICATLRDRICLLCASAIRVRE